MATFEIRCAESPVLVKTTIAAALHLFAASTTDEPMTSVFVDVACYATWIQEQCKKLDTESDCTFNAVPQPKEEVCPDTGNTGTGNSASHLKGSVITLLVYILFVIAKKISVN